MSTDDDWLRQLLRSVQLAPETFVPKITGQLQITRPSHFEFVSDEDLEQIGLSRPAARRLLDAVHKKFPMPTGTDNRVASGASCAAAKEPGKPAVNTQRCSIPSTQISLQNSLGSGLLGDVHKAERMCSHSPKVIVAARMLAPGTLATATGTLSDHIISELNSLCELHHVNVLCMFGIVLTTPKPILVYEYAELGSLKKCLRLPPSDQSGKCKISAITLLEYAVQVAHGLMYLESRGIVHCGLAACNIMLLSLQQVKIGDYGLTRLLPRELQLKSHLTAWFAPESLESGTFTHASDCYMFGVTLWEMFSGGADPWSTLSVAQIKKQLTDGLWLPRPAHCPEKLYQLMTCCSAYLQKDRPLFRSILGALNEITLPEMMAQSDLDERGKLKVANGDIIIILQGGPDSALWEGQNKRTGAKGEFPRTLVLPGTAKTASSKTSPPKTSEVDSVDHSLMDFSDSTAAGGIADALKKSVRPAAFAGWTTFESTTDLTSTGKLQDGHKTDTGPAKLNNGSAVGSVAKPANSYVDMPDRPHKSDNVLPEKITVGRKEMPAVSYNGDEYGSCAEIDVSDRTCLLPASSTTSVSEPCSPAHLSAKRSPDLLAVENVCYDEADGDPHGLCHSLPAGKISERLSWMTSASCENLDVGIRQRPPGSGLCAPPFGEHLSKASSDSPVYVDADLAAAARGSAPPVPPRDYPTQCHSGSESGVRRHVTLPSRNSLKHSEIHPIVQDGQRRSSTHYWLLPEKQRFDMPTPCSKNNGDHIPYVNVSDEQWRRAKPTTKGVLPKHDDTAHSMDETHLKIAMMQDDALHNSENNESLASMGEVCEKVERVRSLVGASAVTPEESYTALAAHQWSVDDAVQYLKIEHLFRLGIASRQVCRAALDAHRWDLEPAASALVDRLPHQNS